MKRLLMALSLALVMALMLAPSALAAKKSVSPEPVLPEGCTYAKGKTTCVTQEEVRGETQYVYITSEPGGSCETPDGKLGLTQLIYYRLHTPVIGYEVTRIYKGIGSDGKLLSTSRVQNGDEYILVEPGPTGGYLGLGVYLEVSDCRAF